MVTVGYHASHEKLPPCELLAQRPFIDAFAEKVRPEVAA